ncbi:MAG: glutamine amidotransferase [Wenzhouxiangellaceae bacterium]
MAKPVLILQLRPEDETADSEYRAFLRYGGLRPDQTERLRIEHTGIPQSLDPGAYSAIIVGGSPFDLSLPETLKSPMQLRIEADFQRLLDQVIANDIPFLGACSGNGLLGRQLGATISTRHAEPVGCVRLRLTEAGRRDPLLAGFPDQIDVLLGHKEACDELPPGAELLLTGSACPVQMFRVGRNVYATQFHPEGDAAGFLLRIRVYRHHGYFRPEEAEVLSRALKGVRTPHAQQILKRFVARYCA